MLTRPQSYSPEDCDKALKLMVHRNLIDLERYSEQFNFDKNGLKNLLEAIVSLNPMYFSGQLTNGFNSYWVIVSSGKSVLIKDFLQSGGFVKREEIQSTEANEAALDREMARREKDLNIRNLQFAVKWAPWTLGIAILGLLIAAVTAFITFLDLFKK